MRALRGCWLVCLRFVDFALLVPEISKHKVQVSVHDNIIFNQS